jgi:hypothetical protein
LLSEAGSTLDKEKWELVDLPFVSILLFFSLPTPSLSNTPTMSGRGSSPEAIMIWFDL